MCFTGQVVNAQLDALRCENRQLRKNALENKVGEGASDTDKTLKELQQAYSDTISSLEVRK